MNVTVMNPIATAIWTAVAWLGLIGALFALGWVLRRIARGVQALVAFLRDLFTLAPRCTVCGEPPRQGVVCIQCGACICKRHAVIDAGADHWSCLSHSAACVAHQRGATWTH